MTDEISWNRYVVRWITGEQDAYEASSTDNARQIASHYAKRPQDDIERVYQDPDWSDTMQTPITPIDYSRIHTPFCGAAVDLWVVEALQTACDGTPGDAAQRLMDATPGMTAEEAHELVATCRAVDSARTWDDIPVTARADYSDCDHPAEAAGVLAHSILHDCWDRWCAAD